MSRLSSIKTRTTSIEKIKKITGALEVVALTRLKRLESQTLNARTYFDKIRELLIGVSKNINYKIHPLFMKKGKAGPVGVICITSDKGLCGNFNNSVFQNFLKFSKEKGGKKKIIAIGKKGAYFFLRQEDCQIIHQFDEVVRADLQEEIKKIAKKLIDEYIEGDLREIYLIFNKFKLHLLGEVNILKLLPMEFKIEEGLVRDYIYEPDRNTIFDELLLELLSNQIYQGILESRSAEEMARMVAMKQATDNADEMIKRLNLTYHKERQKAITRELLDIVNAAQ